MADQAPHAGIFAPFAEGRLWVIMIWALTLGVTLGAWDVAERWLAVAADRPIVLLADKAVDETQRHDLQRRLLGEPAIASAAWRSPAELTQRLKGAMPAPAWGNLFADDEAWTPWAMEVSVTAPLDHAAEIRTFVSRRNQEGSWQLVLWDGAPLERLARWRTILRGTLGFWAALLAMGGGLAVARQTPPVGSMWVLWILSTLLSLGAVTAVWAMTPILGGPADERSLGIGLGVAFLLAGAASPMLRVRGSATAAREPVSPESGERPARATPAKFDFHFTARGSS